MMCDHYDEFLCPTCGSDAEPEVIHRNEDTDADGNRGRMVTYLKCRKCGDEH